MAKKKQRYAYVTKADLVALKCILDMAMENSCSCVESDDAGGYLRHDKGCYVHIMRKYLRQVRRLIDRTEAR